MTNFKTTLAATVLVFAAQSGLVNAQQPSYANYQFDNAQSSALPATLAGHTDNNGIYEPGYVNYKFDLSPQNIDNLIRNAPTAAGGNLDNAGYPGRTDESGLFEPGYVNYKFEN